MPNDSKALRNLLQAETRAGSESVSAADVVLVPGLTILYHPDVERIGERVSLLGLASGREELLDEVGETPLEVQALLLRALESREIQPVGGDAPRRVDVRLIAATDADLEEAVAAGRFRAPLLHRLAGYEIQMPPLRAPR